MCLTIPQKVVEISGDEVTIELPSGDRHKAKTMISLETGDFVLLKGDVIFEKISPEDAREIMELLRGGQV